MLTTNTLRVGSGWNVLRQPGDSFAHDDHIHMRIACTPEEAVQGCLRGGYRWPWLPSLPQPPKETDDALLAALFDDPPKS